MLLSRAKVLAACAAALSCNRLPPGAVAVGTLSVSDGNLARVPELGMPADQVRKEMKAALERTRRRTDDELPRGLADVDSRVRDYAIRALADRRSPAVVPQLIARLEDDNPAVALRAVGALVAIGDRRAVEPLIEMTRKRPPQLVAQVLYALASLGGPTA